MDQNLINNMGMIISEVVEAFRGQKTLYLIGAHFGIPCLVHPIVPVHLTKDSIRNEINYDFLPPFSPHSAFFGQSVGRSVCYMIYH